MTGHQLDPDRLGDHLDRLYRAAWSLCGSREDAEDLVQDTFARVLGRPRFLRSDDDLGYLLRSLQNTFRSTYRARTRRPPEVAMPEDLSLIEDRRAPDPQRHLDAVELYAAISALPGDFRDAVIAVDVMGLSYGEAARALKVKEATLTTRVHRGRRRLASALGEAERA
ncbi:MAG TPA: sigma-70 family RNA polymerase sigma factor [Solirubrobacteraceae bacterium]|nr:sigma-70 family RNA polymerase sigma factor [Solirubrobacteraceae bacterium]